MLHIEEELAVNVVSPWDKHLWILCHFALSFSYIHSDTYGCGEYHPHASLIDPLTDKPHPGGVLRTASSLLAPPFIHPLLSVFSLAGAKAPLRLSIFCSVFLLLLLSLNEHPSNPLVKEHRRESMSETEGKAEWCIDASACSQQAQRKRDAGDPEKKERKKKEGLKRSSQVNAFLIYSSAAIPWEK